MIDFESLIKEYKAIYPDWDQTRIERYARFTSEKYSTIKRGANIVHLDYYGGLLTDSDITEIDNNLNKAGLELSRLDKNGIPYASLQDYTLNVALFLSDPIVSNILLGVSAGAFWDAIKASSFLIWKQIKERYWSKLSEQENLKNQINFGMHVQVDENRSLDLKIEGGLSEKNALKALDKVTEIIKYIKTNSNPSRKKFYHTDKHGNWIEVDIQKEIKKEILKQKKNIKKG